MNQFYNIAAALKKFYANKSLHLIFLITWTFLTFSPVFASTYAPLQEKQDSSLKSLNELHEKYVNYNSDYLQAAELEHQKLLRNIFAVGFFFVMVLLIFTMYFYASKIKKVTNILVLQDDALKSTKDQLIKIIGIFNYIEQQVYITDSKGIVEWANVYAGNYFTEKYEENKINLLQKFAANNQSEILKGINDQAIVIFRDNLFLEKNQWKMIPIKNSKGEFANMVFIS